MVAPQLIFFSDRCVAVVALLLDRLIDHKTGLSGTGGLVPAVAADARSGSG